MRRGEIRWVELDPVMGSEAAKRRPCVIVSNDGANSQCQRSGHGVITVIPITSNTLKVFAFQVLLDPEESGLPQFSKAQAEQIRSVDVRRIGKLVGRLTMEKQAEIEAAIRVHLSLA